MGYWGKKPTVLGLRLHELAEILQVFLEHKSFNGVTDVEDLIYKMDDMKGSSVILTKENDKLNIDYDINEE